MASVIDTPQIVRRNNADRIGRGENPKTILKREGIGLRLDNLTKVMQTTRLMYGLRHPGFPIDLSLREQFDAGGIRRALGRGQIDRMILDPPVDEDHPNISAERTNELARKVQCASPSVSFSSGSDCKAVFMMKGCTNAVAQRPMRP